MSENNDGVIFTPKTEEEGRIDEFPTFEEKSITATITGGTFGTELKEELPILTPEELEKFSPKEESDGVNDGVNDDVSDGEEKELTEEEKRELFINALKESKIRFKNVKHNGNITTVKFGTAYRKERRRKNRAQKASRKANR